MEEQKNSKEIKMTPTEGVEEKPVQKLDYDQLNQVCMELSQQVQKQNNYIQKLLKQLQEMEYMLQARRLDYLLKIVELANTSGTYKFTLDFVEDCISEIQEGLYPKEKPEKKKKED